MYLNEPQMNSVLQQLAKQNQWVSGIAKIAQSLQVSNACLKAFSCCQSPFYAKMIEQTNALGKIVTPTTCPLQQSQLTGAFKILENQQKQLRDMAESPMSKIINESVSLYNSDRQDSWKMSFVFLSQLDLEDRNHLADLALQEVPVLENESANDIPELTEKEVAQWKKLLPSIEKLSFKQVRDFLVNLFTIISLILSIKGCMDADIAHQDAVQIHHDASQVYQALLESQKLAQASQINSSASSAVKK